MFPFGVFSCVHRLGPWTYDPVAEVQERLKDRSQKKRNSDPLTLLKSRDLEVREDTGPHRDEVSLRAFFCNVRIFSTGRGGVSTLLCPLLD